MQDWQQRQAQRQAQRQKQARQLAQAQKMATMCDNVATLAMWAIITGVFCFGFSVCCFAMWAFSTQTPTTDTLDFLRTLFVGGVAVGFVASILQVVAKLVGDHWHYKAQHLQQLATFCRRRNW